MDLILEIEQRYEEDAFLIAVGFDDAVIGVDETEMRLIYSVSKCLEILEQTMPPGEAVEHFMFNVVGSYVGPKTPIWCWDNF